MWKVSAGNLVTHHVRARESCRVSGFSDVALQDIAFLTGGVVILKIGMELEATERLGQANVL